MSRHTRHSAALRAAILGLILIGAAVLFGCTAPAAMGRQGTATAKPTATGGVSGTATAGATPTALAATAGELTNAVCVCHVQDEQGAPPVAQLAALSSSAIMQAVRQGRGAMPAWSTGNLSDQWLNEIVNQVKSSGQGTPTAATSELP